MFSDLKSYVNQRITLTKYEFVDSMSNMFASGIFAIIVAAAFLFLILLGSLATGFLLGDYFNNYGYGFLAVTGLYFLFLILCLIFRKNLKNLLADIAVESAMNAMSNQDEDDDEE
ncbi:MAG: phage holin family protein [Weeksellaceae bacterium]|nr:phage holin family protein [Weeksellaceae bacterium]